MESPVDECLAYSEDRVRIDCIHRNCRDKGWWPLQQHWFSACGVHGMRYASAGIAGSSRSLTQPTGPPDFSYIKASIPDDVSRDFIDIDHLPLNWHMWPHPDSTRVIGDDWLARRTSCVLLVPSAVTRVDYNCLINPQHPDFGLIEIAPPMPLHFDKRIVESNL
ncbi:MAG TPA: hypothetical protein DDW52_03675 [Planctomycetaceae bacterium]|nr:hypothetical protein [Planctomycetaceae bacterium]